MCVASALIWKTEESEYEESHVRARNGMILLGRVTAMGTKKGKEKKQKGNLR